MKVQDIGSRGVLFTFYELDGYPTNVYVIRGDHHTFVCDTFLGPECMEEITHHLRYHYGETPYIIFNSHYHWDHVWGNCAFESAPILAHRLCRELMKEKGRRELDEHEEYEAGDVELILPSVTFTEQIEFRDEQVEFFYSPGHTEDSASCLDRKDKILFVGDNVEVPIPYLFSKDLRAYEETLENYLATEYDRMILGHGSSPGRSVIQENLEYIRAFLQDDTSKYEKDPYGAIHRMNVELQK